jgi:hypothetical protein
MLEKLDDNDLVMGNNKILVTGNSKILEGMHGVIIETEEAYKHLLDEDGNIVENITLQYDSIDGSDLLFKYYIVLGLGALNRASLKPKRRPSGFVSNSCNGLELEISADMDVFSDMYRSYITGPKLRIYNTDGGITIASKDDGALFDLSEAPIVTKNTEEVVKRIKIPHKILKEFIENKDNGHSFFEQIKEEMESLGCKHYTFKRPDGSDALYRSQYASTIEIRAYGKRLED